MFLALVISQSSFMKRKYTIRTTFFLTTHIYITVVVLKNGHAYILKKDKRYYYLCLGTDIIKCNNDDVRIISK